MSSQNGKAPTWRRRLEAVRALPVRPANPGLVDRGVS
jgi:hypothetical protein